ncbi:MAG TPA: nitrous oxide reductase accessory protein NosL [Chryseosolibacter sp.]
MRIVIAVSLISLLLSCTVEPEPLEYGQDACHTCRMTLVDKRFGAELVTTKGKVYKFDDINCMLAFFNSGEVDHRGYAYKLVVDFDKPASFTEATEAFYLKSAALKTPMASQIAAFSRKEDMETRKKELKGIYLVWGELVTQFK